MENAEEDPGCYLKQQFMIVYEIFRATNNPLYKIGKTELGWICDPLAWQ